MSHRPHRQAAVEQATCAGGSAGGSGDGDPMGVGEFLRNTRVSGLDHLRRHAQAGRLVGEAGGEVASLVTLVYRPPPLPPVKDLPSVLFGGDLGRSSGVFTWHHAAPVSAHAPPGHRLCWDRWHPVGELRACLDHGVRNLEFL